MQNGSICFFYSVAYIKKTFAFTPRCEILKVTFKHGIGKQLE